MIDIQLKRLVFKTSREKTSVYSAVYMNEKCYAIVHRETGFIAVFDYDKRVLASMKRFMREKGYSLFYDKDPSGLPRFRFGTTTGQKSYIDLRQFLWARYNKRYLSSLQGFVGLRTDDRAESNICDLRRFNIFMPGESIENRDDIAVRLISNSKNENKKWIEVTFSKGEPFIEYIQYTPELWEMLNTPRYVRLTTKDTVRGAVEVDGYAERDNLARFVCIYKKYFPVYAGKKNAIKRFIGDYSKYSRELENGNDAAHINSYYHENTFDNLMFMDGSTNKGMFDYIKWLADGYEAYTAVNTRDEILLEFVTPFNQSPLYYKFETPEDYADFQRVYIFGTKLSNKLQRVVYPTPEGLAYQLTPIGMRAAGIVNKETVKAKELDFWTDREHKDKLLTMPDDSFIVYRKDSLKSWLNHFLVGVKLPEGMKRGDKFFFPLDGGGVGKVELVKTGRQKRGMIDKK